MIDMRGLVRLAIGAIIALTVSSAKAQESIATEETYPFTVDGAFIWMGTWGNDVVAGGTITSEERFGRDRQATSILEDVNELVTEMKNTGVPWAQIGFERGKWGTAVEFWTLDTDGSATTEDESFELFRRPDTTVRFGDADYHFQAANDFSLWSMRVVLTRTLSKWLTLGAGLQTGEWKNRIIESQDLVDPSTFEGEPPTTVTSAMESKSSGTLLGPSVDVRGTARIGELATVRFIAAQAVLFSTFKK